MRVYGIDERRQLRAQDMADAATVIVATVQSFGVNNVADRNVYKDDEELEPHFAALPPEQTWRDTRTACAVASRWLASPT